MDTTSAAGEAINAVASRFVGHDAGRSIVIACRAPFACDVRIGEDVPRPAASIVKIALAMTIFDKARDGSVDLGEKLPLARFGKTRYVSILAGFDGTHAFSLREVCALALITSDNPLTVALQDYASFDEVNVFMRGLGLGPENVMAAGFREDELGPPGRANRLTAQGCLALFDAVRKDPFYAPLYRALQNNLRNARIPARLPDSAAIAHKTGTLEGVVNDAGIVTDGAVDFSLVCLTENQPDPDAAARDIAACAAGVHGILKGG